MQFSVGCHGKWICTILYHSPNPGALLLADMEVFQAQDCGGRGTFAAAVWGGVFRVCKGGADIHSLYSVGVEHSYLVNVFLLEN
jgi:hypothetical protein